MRSVSVGAIGTMVAMLVASTSVAKAAPVDPLNRWMCSVVGGQLDLTSAGNSFPFGALKLSDGFIDPNLISGERQYGEASGYSVFYGKSKVGSANGLNYLAIGPITLGVEVKNKDPKIPEAMARRRAEWGVPQKTSFGRSGEGSEFLGPNGRMFAISGEGPSITLVWRSGSNDLVRRVCNGGAATRGAMMAASTDGRPRFLFGNCVYGQFSFTEKYSLEDRKYYIRSAIDTCRSKFGYIDRKIQDKEIPDFGTFVQGLEADLLAWKPLN